MIIIIVIVVIIIVMINLKKGFETNEVEWIRRWKLKRKTFLAVDEPCMAIFWPTPSFRGRTFHRSGVSTERALFLHPHQATPLRVSFYERFDRGGVRTQQARTMKRVGDQVTQLFDISEEDFCGKWRNSCACAHVQVLLITCINANFVCLVA